MLYKRGISKVEDARSVEYVMTSGLGIYMNTSVIGENTSPLHGLYIRQQNGHSDIYLSKMIEKYEVNGKTYSIYDIKTNEQNTGGVEYLETFERYPVPTYVYYLDGCKIVKKYKYVLNTNILCIEYEINNNTKKGLKLNAYPCVTRRGILKLKRKQEMKYSSLDTVTGVKISLCISENLNLYIKSNNMKYNKKEQYLCGITCNLQLQGDSIKTFVEDNFIPGDFEITVKPGATKTCAVYVMTEDENIDNFNSRDIELKYIEEEKAKTIKIDAAYHELKDLAVNAYSFQYIDKKNKKFVICESLPEIKESKEYIKHIITSLEGNYILLGRYKEAKKILQAMILKLDSIGNELNELDKVESVLLFIEVLNRYIQLSECDVQDIYPFYKYIKTKIYEYMNGDKSKDQIYIDDNNFLCVDGGIYIKINSLWYNALKIFTSLSDKFSDTNNIYDMAEELKDNIMNEFWDEGEKVLKYELNGPAYPNFDMIYSQSLSYPMIKDNISMKIIDTAFKQLYTPLGMRKFGVLQKEYDGYVYPHLMVHFIKANLRQMGVTRATQKLAFNLVKDLLAEMNKDTVGSVKYKYMEKNRKAYGQALSAITNAELIRMYDMLT